MADDRGGREAVPNDAPGQGGTKTSMSMAEAKGRTAVEQAFLDENPYAAEAERLLQRAVEKRSEHVLRRGEIYATLAVAFEQRQTRFALENTLRDHAEMTATH